MTANNVQPMSQRQADVLRNEWGLLLKMGFHVLVTAPRLRHLEKITRGLLHGLMGRAGGIAER